MHPSTVHCSQKWSGVAVRKPFLKKGNRKKRLRCAKLYKSCTENLKGGAASLPENATDATLIKDLWCGTLTRPMPKPEKIKAVLVETGCK